MGGSVGLVERKENAPEPHAALAKEENAKWKGKQRAHQSVGGRGQVDAEGKAIPLAIPSKPVHSPKSQARRLAVSSLLIWCGRTARIV